MSTIALYNIKYKNKQNPPIPPKKKIQKKFHLFLLFILFSANEMKSKSLHALANIPCSFEVNNWKHSIFCGIIDSMQQSNNTQFVVEVIQSVPVLLLDTTQHPSSILQNILLPTLESRSEIILTAVSEVFASIVCVLSGDVAITR